MINGKNLIVMICITILAIGVSALAIAPADATYKGTKACKMCHGGISKDIVAAYGNSAHAKAFADIGETPAAIVAQFGDAAPIKKDQIKYVLASGRTRQAYLDADLKVLPAEWDVVNKKWETIPAADGATQCLGCHTVGFDTASKKWVQAGVGCESCHGPGSAHAAGGDKTKITNPKTLAKDREAMVCGQCHSKGTDTTKTYAFPVKFRPGDDLATAFVDAKPTTTGRNQQFSEMITGKHWGAGVVCTTCHDPHGVGGNKAQLRKASIVELCMGCHKDKDMKTHAPNAAAGATCATCHMPNGVHTFKKA